MKLSIDGGLCFMTPVSTEESYVLGTWRERLEPEAKLDYRGRGADDGKFWTIVIEGLDLRLRIVGESDVEKDIVQGLRNACYFGKGGGLTYLGPHDGGGIVVTGVRCKLCRSPMIEMAACEWHTCDACAAKCDHEVTRGFTHSESKEMDVGDFCAKCGRAQPR